MLDHPFSLQIADLKQLYEILHAEVCTVQCTDGLPKVYSATNNPCALSLSCEQNGLSRSHVTPGSGSPK